MTLRIVFDLDETLIDSVPALAASANVMLAELGRAPVAAADYQAFVGHGMRQQVKRALEFTGGVPEGGVGPHLARMIEVYGADPARGTHVYPGVHEALTALSAAGHGLAVCTQKPEAQARRVLADLGLAPPITGLTGGGTLDVLKPDPAMLRHAAAQLPGDGPVVMIGDRDVDAQTAANAGARFIHFAPDGPQDLGVPVTATFAHWAQLPEIVASLLEPST